MISFCFLVDMNLPSETVTNLQQGWSVLGYTN